MLMTCFIDREVEKIALYSYTFNFSTYILLYNNVYIIHYMHDQDSCVMQRKCVRIKIIEGLQN